MNHIVSIVVRCNLDFEMQSSFLQSMRGVIRVELAAGHWTEGSSELGVVRVGGHQSWTNSWSLDISVQTLEWPTNFDQEQIHLYDIDGQSKYNQNPLCLTKYLTLNCPKQRIPLSVHNTFYVSLLHHWWAEHSVCLHRLMDFIQFTHL